MSKELLCFKVITVLVNKLPRNCAECRFSRPNEVFSEYTDCFVLNETFKNQPNRPEECLLTSVEDYDEQTK